MSPFDPSFPPVLLVAKIGDAAALRERLGHATYTRVRSRHADLFAQLCAAFPGAAVQACNGDGCRASFGTVEDAAWFASRFEQAVRDEPWGSAGVTSRIAIHLVESSRDADAAKPAAADLPQPSTPLASDAPRADVLRRLSADLYRADEPTEVGAYRIVQTLGEGGMGIVYKAEQRYPVKRVVALKLIKLGMDTKQVMARFESERQALALMDHPNVAKVFDAGATATGRPYFVMEYVPGEPITSFCDRHRFTTRQRLELFVQAAEAVQHAHQKAIIHRDLKPSNMLVTLEDGRPLVKMIDFGVAKALSQRLTERTMFTETGQLVGTPEYMSPEQADAASADVDTRADIYSLGVVLYELLCGALPFDPKSLRGAAYGEIQRLIRGVDPPRPSARLTQLTDGAAEVARLRGTRPDALARELRRELEWIPLKAMHKERDRRYATALELALDIQNYLANRPLLAGPETIAYRARKFVRRNKGPVIAVGALLFVLSLGVIGIAVAQRDAATQRDRAERRFDELRAIANGLTTELDPAVAEVLGTTIARQRLAEMSVQYLDKLATDATGDASLLEEVAHAYGRVAQLQGLPGYPRNLGEVAGALDSCNKQRRILERLARDDPRFYGFLATCLRDIGKLHLEREELQQAALALRSAVEFGERAVAAEPNEQHWRHTLRDFHMTLGDALRKLGDAQGAADSYERGREQIRICGDPIRDVAEYFECTGALRETLRDTAGATRYRREALAIWTQAAAEEDRALDADEQDGGVYIRIGMLHGALGEWDKALQAYEHLLPKRRRLATTQPLSVPRLSEAWYVHDKIGEALLNLGRQDEACDSYREALRLAEWQAGADPIDAVAQRRYLKSVGNVVLALASVSSDTRKSTDARLFRWGEARTYAATHRAKYESMKKQGTLLPRDVRQAEDVVRQLQLAEDAIAAVEATTHPTTSPPGQ